MVDARGRPKVDVKPYAAGFMSETPSESTVWSPQSEERAQISGRKPRNLLGFLASPSPKESLEVVKAAAKRSKACGGLADLLEKAAEELGEGKVIHKSTELIPLLSSCGCEPKAGKTTLL